MSDDAFSEGPNKAGQIVCPLNDELSQSLMTNVKRQDRLTTAMTMSESETIAIRMRLRRDAAAKRKNDDNQSPEYSLILFTPNMLSFSADKPADKASK